MAHEPQATAGSPHAAALPRIARDSAILALVAAGVGLGVWSVAARGPCGSFSGDQDALAGTGGLLALASTLFVGRFLLRARLVAIAVGLALGVALYVGAAALVVFPLCEA